MDIKILGKEIKPTDAIESYIEKKVQRLEKYFTKDAQLTVTLKEEKNMKISTFALVEGKNRFRTIAEHPDLYASIDKNIDLLERQIKKTKEMAKDKRVVVDILDDEEFEVEDDIIKFQAYETKPITVEDAKLMLKNHKTNNFYTFVNSETNQVNVIFKLKDGKNYGLVIQEN